MICKGEPAEEEGCALRKEHAYMQGIITVIINMALSLFVTQLAILAIRLLGARLLSARARYALWGLAPLSVLAALWDMPLISGAYLNLIAQLWCIVAALILFLELFFFLRQYVQLRGSRKISSRIFDICLRDCKAEHTAVSLTRSNAVDLPITWGLFFKKIILPANIDLEDTSLMYHLCCHELFHAKRSDNLRRLIFRLFQAAFWFNPLMWLCYPLFLHDMEDSCDESALRVSGKIKYEEYRRMIRISQTPSQEEKEEIRVHVLPHVSRYTARRLEKLKSACRVRRHPAFWAVAALLLIVGAGVGGWFLRSPVLLAGSHVSFDGEEGKNISRMDLFCANVKEGANDAVELLITAEGGRVKYNLVFENGILLCRIQEPGSKAYFRTYSRITRTQQDGMVYYSLISDTERRELLAAPDEGAREQTEENLELFYEKFNSMLGYKTGQINVTNLKTIYAGSMDNIIRASSQAAYLYNYDAVQQEKVTMLKDNTVESGTASAGELRLVQDSIESTFGTVGIYRRDYDEEAAKYMFGDLFLFFRTAMKEQYLQNSNMTVGADRKIGNITFTFNSRFEEECSHLFEEDIPGIDSLRPPGNLYTTLDIKFDSFENIQSMTLRRYCRQEEETMHLRTAIYDFSMVGQEADLYKEVNLDSFRRANLLLEDLAELSPDSIWIQGVVEGTDQNFFFIDSPDKILQFVQLLGDLGLSIQGDGSVMESTPILTVEMGKITLSLSKDQKRIIVESGDGRAMFSTQMVAYRYLCNWLVQNIKE